MRRSTITVFIITAVLCNLIPVTSMGENLVSEKHLDDYAVTNEVLSDETMADNAENLLDYFKYFGPDRSIMIADAMELKKNRDTIVEQIQALVPSVVSDPPSDRGELKAGVGVRVITPPRGCPLAGYGDRLKTIPFSYHPFRIRSP